MLKLMKYDFRRNRDMILAVFVITILAQIGGALANLADNDMFILNTVTYVVAAIILYVSAIRTYVHNLKSYNRRLLPERTLYTVLSPMLLLLVLLLGVGIMVLIHLGVYNIVYSTSFLPTQFWKEASFGVVQIFWLFGFSMLLIMFSITVALSIRFKGRGRVWIGIATMFILHNGISLLEQWIFNSYFSTLDSALRVGMVDGSMFRSDMISSQGVFSIWPTLFEAVIAVIIVYGIVKLVNKRVES